MKAVEEYVLVFMFGLVRVIDNPCSLSPSSKTDGRGGEAGEGSHPSSLLCSWLNSGIQFSF